MARQVSETRETNVVDLLRYRNARVSKPLPLFDAPPAGDLPRVVTVSAFRVLSAKEVSHRARMLAHLRALPRPPFGARLD
jgi:hypothetical protein